jgi:hypothetical protein
MAATYYTLCAQLERAIVDDDLDGFRKLAFSQDAGSVFRPEVAAVMREGFEKGELGGVPFARSFMAKCLANRRPQFVHEVMTRARAVFGDDDSRLRDLFAALCSARRGEAHEFVSPPQLIRQRRSELAEYREFVSLTLEYMPDDEALERARQRWDGDRAFIAECAMALRIRQRQAAAADTPSATTAVLGEQVAPAQRRSL